jgi:hypothetical protein
MAEPENNLDGSGGPKPPAAARRKKSTGFPVVSLAEAASILKEAGKYGFDHSTPMFASYMGHSTTNSGAFRQRLAAFRDWKLIAGRGDSLSMTDIARKIALPPDAETERRALREAFMNSPVFARLYEDMGKNQPLATANLGSKAVHDFGIAPASRDKFVQSFVDSAVAAGLGEIADDGQIVLRSSADDSDADDGSSFDRVVATDTPQSGSVGRAVAAPARPQPTTAEGVPLVHQVWEIDGGSIVFEIRTDKPLPAAVFVTVGEVVASLEHLAETLAPEVPAEGDGAAEMEG